MGLCLQNGQRLNEALACYQKAVEINPGFAGAYLNMGTILQDKGDPAGAMDYYYEVLRIAPGQAEVHNNLGNALQRLNRTDEALEQYRKATEAKPEYIKAHYNLGKLLEETHRLEEAHTAALAGLAHAPFDPDISLYRGQVRKAVGAAAKGHNPPDGPFELRHKILLKGQGGYSLRVGACLYEQIKDSDQAFAHFTLANNFAAQTPEAAKTHKKYFLEELNALSGHFKREPVNWRAADIYVSRGDTPCFLVGFPRSGTTLLDQILDSHPKLRTLEEKPVFDAVRERLAAMPQGFPAALDELSEEELHDLRGARYWAKAKEYLASCQEDIFIDKLPLNIINAGPIWRIFPKAKFVLAIRHPLDVCLSCFMAEFQHQQRHGQLFDHSGHGQPLRPGDGPLATIHRDAPP